MWILANPGYVLATKSNANPVFVAKVFLIILCRISLEDPGAKLSYAKGSLKCGDVVISLN